MKHLIKTGLILLCIFKSINCLGQTTSKYTLSPTSTFNIIKAIGGGYYAVSTNDSTILMRLSAELDVIWTKKLETSPRFTNSNIYQGPSSNLYVYGDSLSVVLQGYNVGGGYFKLDSAGNFIHFTSFDRGIFASNFIEYNANELIISASHFVGNANVDYDFLKYDSSGTKVFSKDRGFTMYTRYNVNLLQTANHLYRLGWEPDGGDGFMSIYQYDHASEYWNKFKRFQFPTGVLLGTNLIELPNGNFFFSNCGYDSPNNSSNYFCILDTGFNVLRERSYEFNYIPTSTSSDLRRSLQALGRDSLIVIFGKTNTNPSALCIFKLDQNLNILWSNSFEGGTDAWPNAILNTADGGFLLSYTKSQVNYLIKSDSLGTINCLQQFSINISSSTILPNIYDGSIITDNVNTSYPADTMLFNTNSSSYTFDDFCNLVSVENINHHENYKLSITNGFLNISIEDEKGISKCIQIISMLGQTLLSEKFSTNHFSKNISNLTSGIYLIRVEVNGRLFTKMIYN